MLRASSFVVVVAALLAGGDITHAEAPTQRIVVQNYYYARAGKSDDVYALRLHASDVRASLGLPRGRVLRRVKNASSSAELPDVIWECEYTDLAARERDVAALGHSAEFEQVEKRMDSLLSRFQRAQFTLGGE